MATVVAATPARTTDGAAVQPAARLTGRTAARTRYPARAEAEDWAATRQSREQVLERLHQPPFVVDNAKSQQYRSAGLTLLLDWLADQPGRTWQQRWMASGADTAPNWWAVSTRWLHNNDIPAWRQEPLSAALWLAIGADVLRPSLAWLVSKTAGKGLTSNLIRCRDPEGFARLRTQTVDEPGISRIVALLTLRRGAIILAAKGGMLTDITIGDVLQLLDMEAECDRKPNGGAAVFYQQLHRLGIFGADAPGSLQQVRTLGQLTVEQLIDRYQLACRPVRDLLVDYLRERQPTLDYASLEALAYHLGRLFWQDLERHHPGIDSLRLPAEVADAWKQRLRTMRKTVPTAAGDKTQTVVPRINYWQCLTPVRAFYLDLAQWAVEDPARWAPWAVPSPIGADEINRRKAKRQHKSRMDARTRQRLPVLPVLVRTVEQRRTASRALLDTARNTPPGQPFTTARQTLIRAVTPLAAPHKIWVDDPATGKLGVTA